MQNNFSMKSELNSIDTEKAGVHALSDGELEQFHKALLGIYADVFDACEKHGLQLFLQGGTLLGQVRHDGFIPWDDDMDLGMARSHYNKLIRIFDEELSEKYLLRAPGYHGGVATRFIKIYKKDSYLDTLEMTPEVPHKISIDIFPIDFAPDNALLRKWKGLSCNWRMLVISSIEFDMFCTDSMKQELKRTAKGRVNYMIRRLIAGLYGKADREKLYAKLDRAASGARRTKYATSSMGRWHYLGEMQSADIFFPLKKAQFCGEKAWTLHDPEGYLLHNYGPDYMVVPENAKREKHFVKKLNVES